MPSLRRPRRPRPPSTEKLHPLAEELDLQSSLEIVRRLNAEDVTAARAVGKVSRAIARAAVLAAEAIGQQRRLLYVGAGTSGRLGVLDAAECPPTFGTDPDSVVGVIAGGERALRTAVEGAEDDAWLGADAIRLHHVKKGDVVCGITASGRTPFVLAALDAARRKGAKTILVCCARPLPDAHRADVVVFADTGPELVAGSTRLKAGTATKLILNAISTTAMVRLGKVYRGRMIDLQSTNEKLQRRARQIVVDLGRVEGATATELLRKAEGSVRLALAMALTGAPLPEASARESRFGLRKLGAPARKR